MRKPRKAKMAQPAEQEPDEVVDLTGAAAFLKVSKPTFYRWLAQDRIKGFKAGTQWRFYRKDLEKFLVTEEPRELHEPAGLTQAIDKAREVRNLPPINWDEFTGEEEGGQSAVATTWNTIFKEAIKGRASDIHLDVNVDQTLIRYRTDGVLSEVLALPREAARPLVARLKLMADMDIGERRLPQNGRIHADYEGRDYDLRTITMPAVYGESAVIRILDQRSVVAGLDRLGFCPETQQTLERKLREPQGLIIVAGPAGSGRTTTLYSALNMVNDPTKKIVTVEDPVEYRLRNLMQVHVNRRAGLTFAVGIRNFVRCDPDIILVGDLQELETAELCMQAALTGHLVLTAMLPTNSPSVITRLTDMGVEPFLIATALSAVLSQRLVREVCKHCRTEHRPSPALIERLQAETGMNLAAATFYTGKGCDECRGYGYRGRTALFELLEMNDRLRDLTVRRASTAEIRQAAIESGMVTMLQGGLRKAMDGITTIEEVMRVLGTDRAS
jgi:excisionase family DNA binding protein